MIIDRNPVIGKSDWGSGNDPLKLSEFLYDEAALLWTIVDIVKEGDKSKVEKLLDILKKRSVELLTNADRLEYSTEQQLSFKEEQCKRDQRRH